MASIVLELPEEVFSSLRRSSDEFVREMRLAAAIHWYERGELSQEKAAGLAFLCRNRGQRSASSACCARAMPGWSLSAFWNASRAALLFPRPWYARPW